MLICPICKSSVEMKRSDENDFLFTCTNQCFKNISIFAHSDLEAKGFWLGRSAEIVSSELRNNQ